MVYSENFFILIYIVTGHALLWSKAFNNPSWTWSLYGQEFESVVYKHVDDTMDHFNTKNIVHWDTINEMIDQGKGPLEKNV